MLADLQARVASAESRVRTCEAEQARMHDEVRKWMRRAEAAERRAEQREPNQEQLSLERPPGNAVTPAPVVVPPGRKLWGARARIAARRAKAALGVPVTSAANGSQPAELEEEE